MKRVLLAVLLICFSCRAQDDPPAAKPVYGPWSYICPAGINNSCVRVIQGAGMCRQVSYSTATWFECKKFHLVESKKRAK